MRRCGPPTCHPERPYEARGLCAACYSRQRRKERPPLSTEHRRELARKATERYRAKNTEQDKKNNHIRTGLRIGWTDEKYESCWIEQQGQCAICSVLMDRTFGVKTPHRACRDHCHTSMKPRDLLCMTCNQMLGHYEKRLKGRIVIEPFDVYILKHSQVED